MPRRKTVREAPFKARVALEAVKERETVGELAKRFQAALHDLLRSKHRPEDEAWTQGA